MPYHIIYNEQQRSGPRITEKLAPDPPDPEETQTDEVIVAQAIDVTNNPSEPGEITIKVSSMPLVSIDETAAADTSEELPAMKPRRRSYRRPLLIGGLTLAIAGALLAILIFTPLLSWLTPLKATITIMPARDSSTITRTVPIAQLGGHQLAPVSVTASATAATTGIGRRPATVATGAILLYNGTTTPQIVLAGTRIVGRSGIVVATSATVTVPAAILPTEGTVSVRGQALATGPGGNIAAGDLHGAAVQASIVADNGAFSGGAAAYTYQAVSARDIAHLVASLKASLLEQAGHQVQVQLAAGEASTTPSCSYQQQASASPGDETKQVTVREVATCQGLAYSSTALQVLATRWLARPSYMLAAAPQTAVIVTKELAQVTLAASWVYQWNKIEIARLRALLAGKTKVQALALLRQEEGIRNAFLTLSKDSQRLPSSGADIYLIVTEN